MGLDQTNTTLKKVVAGISTTMRNVIDSNVDELKTTVDKVDCSVVGDVYHTISKSLCSDGLQGFSDYAWTFVWCGFIGLLLIVATILLNVFVGLRKNIGKDKDNRVEVEIPHMPRAGSYSVDRSHAEHAELYPALEREYIHNPNPNPTPIAMAEPIPEAVPAVAASAASTGKYNKDQYL